MGQRDKRHEAKEKKWFLGQVGKATDCNSVIIGSSPVGTSICDNALVAQLDRVLDYGSRGCGFDSCLARRFFSGSSTAW